MTCKLKQQWNTIIYLLEWLNSKILTKSNADKDVEQGKLSFITGENAECDSSFRREFDSLFQKLNIIPIPDSATALVCLFKWVENLCPYENLHMDVYGSFLHTCWNLEATKMPFSRWVDKQIVVHPEKMKYCSVLKKKWALGFPWRSSG